MEKEDFSKKIDEILTSGFKKVESGIKLTDDDKRYILKAARRSLEAYFSDKKITIEDFKDIPPNIASQSFRIFITLINNGRLRGCMSGKKGNLLERAIIGVNRAIEDKRFGGVLKKEELPDIKIDVTILLKSVRIKKRKIKNLKREIELGIHSLMLRYGSKRAFFKCSVPISHGYSLKKTLDKLRKKARISKGDGTTGST